MVSAFLQENDNNNKKKSTEQESDASMYNLLMVEKKKDVWDGRMLVYNESCFWCEGRERKQGVVGK